MAGKKTTEKKRSKKNSLLNTITVVVLFALIVGTAAFVWVLYTKNLDMEKGRQAMRQVRAAAAKAHAYPPAPTTLVNDSVPDTVRAAKKNGWIPCPGECLKLATPGWHHLEVANHPPTDVWFDFYHRGGGYSYNQLHAGHIIKEYADRQATDSGACPVCEGTGWVRKDFKF